MNPVAVAAVVLGAGAAALAAALAGAPRLPAPASSRREPSRPPLVLRLRPMLAVLTAAGGWALVGGPIGAAVGAAAAAVLWRLLRDAESATVAEQRAQLVRDLPLAVDLLMSCLQSGAALEGSLLTVADAVGGPVAARFRVVDHRLALGADPATVWREVATDQELAALGRAMLRAHESGASVTDAVRDLAADLRERERTDAQVRANAVEVKASGPLAACFLPAFVLIGIVPLIAGAVTSVGFLGP